MTKGLLGFILSTLIFQSYGQFSPTIDYISSNKNKWTIEVPEVQELIHIIIAITPTGENDLNMVQHDTKYYKNVMNYFQKYEGHEIVRKVNNLLKKGRYAHVKMDACGFFINEQGRIVKDKTYKQLNWSNINYVESLTSDLEDFSVKTKFREFYKSNLTFYNELIELMKIQMPIDKQWKWLEEMFPNKYDNYRITFSPLVNGSHSTNRFEADNFKQTVMFICGPITNPNWTDKIKEGLMTRVVFTEIDHNYVNPVSDKFKNEISKIFSSRTKWTSGKDSKGYGSPISVFNEYMTWSVFNLYALDTFDESDFKTINERVEVQMSDWRGFSKFKEFNQKLVELYKNKNSGQSIVDLYPLIIDWCRHE
ncbi:MAG: DUF4932 domain-containing protein [Cytophagales bacterium]|nr:DUF4932 domain-containing protein [Cytophagales bacterium]